MRALKIFLTIIVLFAFIDIPMIMYINNAMYKKQFLRINNGPTDIGNLRLYISALICYLLLAIGVYNFAIKEKSIVNGALIGLIIYGVYNTTNLVSINQFGIKEAIVDTLWGTTLCTFVTYVTLKLFTE